MNGFNNAVNIAGGFPEVPGGNMKIIEFLKPEFIQLHTPVHSRDEAIRLMIDEVYKLAPFTPAKPDVKKLIHEKKIEGGPAFGNGLSVYIWRNDDIKDLMVSMCVPKKPLHIDNKSISLVTLIATCPHPLKSYVDVIYDLILLAENFPSMLQLTQSESRDEFIQTLKGYHEEYEKF